MITVDRTHADATLATDDDRVIGSTSLGSPARAHALASAACRLLRFGDRKRVVHARFPADDENHIELVHTPIPGDHDLAIVVPLPYERCPLENAATVADAADIVAVLVTDARSVLLANLLGSQIED